ncbi:MAG: DUF4340 domain-containing protein [Kiritimatiellia bacterium]
MKRNTTLGLAALVLFLASFLYILDHRTSPPDAGAASSRVFDITTEPITLIGVEHDGEVIEVVRRDDHWVLQKPVRARASGLLVNRLVAAAERLRSLDVITAEQRALRDLSLADYGLDPAASTFFVEAGGRREVLRLGRRTPFGEGVYGLQQETGAVVVLPAEVMRLFTPKLDDLRDRSLFAGSQRRVTRVDLYRREAGFMQLIRRGTRWYIQQPLEWLADAGMVQQLLDALYVLQIQGFVWDAPWHADDGVQSPAFRSQVDSASLAPDQAWARIMVWVEGSETGEELFLGRADENMEEHLYARRGGVPSVFTVPRVLGDLVSQSARMYRDRRVLDVSIDEITRLHFSYRDHRLTLEKTGDGRWGLVAPVVTAVQGDVVHQLLRDLLDMRIVSFDTEDAGLEGDVLDVQLDFRGDTERQTRLYLEPVAEAEGGVQWIGRMGQGGELLQLSGFAAGRDVEALLQPFRYRARTVLAVDPRSISRLVYTSVRGDVVLQRRNGDAPTGWEQVDEGGGVLDPDALQQMLVVLTKLDAESVVAFDAPSLAVFGLNAPVATITIRYADPGRLQQSLLLGLGPEDNVVYAMLQGHGFVYRLRDADADILRSELVVVPVAGLPEASQEVIIAPSDEVAVRNGDIPAMSLQDEDR